jgi:hypothetical protein
MSSSTKQKPGDRILSVRQAVEYMDKHIGGFDEHSGYQHFISESKLRRLLNRGHWPITRTADGQMGITVRDLRRPFRAKPLHPKPLSPRMQARLDRDRDHARAFHAAQEAAGKVWDGTAWVRPDLAKSA